MTKPLRHGRDSTYTHGKCRCVTCRNAHNTRIRLCRAEARAKGLPDGDPRHGTMAGYGYWGCNCDLCRAAARAKYAARRRAS